MDFVKAEAGSLWVLPFKEDGPTYLDEITFWQIFKDKNSINGQTRLDNADPIISNVPIMKLGEKQFVRMQWAKSRNGDSGFFDALYHKVMAETLERGIKIGWIHDSRVKELIPFE